jgi:hypothetical protein
MMCQCATCRETRRAMLSMRDGSDITTPAERFPSWSEGSASRSMCRVIAAQPSPAAR